MLRLSRIASVGSCGLLPAGLKRPVQSTDRQGASKVEAQGAHGHRKNDENDPQCEGEAQFALACFQGDGRRHRASIAPYIAADDDDRADFGNGPTEGRKEGIRQFIDEKSFKPGLGAYDRARAKP